MTIEALTDLAIGLTVAIINKSDTPRTDLQETASNAYALFHDLLGALYEEDHKAYARTEAIRKPAISERA